MPAPADRFRRIAQDVVVWHAISDARVHFDGGAANTPQRSRRIDSPLRPDIGGRPPTRSSPPDPPGTPDRTPECRLLGPPDG